MTRDPRFLRARPVRPHATDGLGHRRILRDPDVIAQTCAFVGHGVTPAASELVREVDGLLAAEGV